MKQFWTDLKSFITISMIVLLFIIVIANLFGYTLQDNLLLLVSNLISATFAYYFNKAIAKINDINANINDTGAKINDTDTKGKN